MPTFDLKGIKIGKYVNTSGAIAYENVVSMGDAMNVNLQMTFAEGRLFAEGALAEYMRLATGGTVSVGVKYIPTEAQKLMYGHTERSRTVNTKEVTSLVSSANDVASYVGMAFYAPDQIDGATKYTCAHVKKALFGPPAMVYQTKGDNIVFQTPTTTGEFLPDDSSGRDLIEVAVLETQADAIAWVNLVLGVDSAAPTVG